VGLSYQSINTMSQKSSVEAKGKVVTQITGFRDGTKKTWRGVKTDTIEEGSFCKFETTDGRKVYVNINNVNWFEILPIYNQN
jgi:hypothetical protein